MEYFDAVIRDYAGRLQRIYDERTAGDHTFSGVLAEFLRVTQDVRPFRRAVWTHEQCVEWVRNNCVHMQADRKVVPVIKALREGHREATGEALGLLEAKNAVYAAWGWGW